MQKLLPSLLRHYWIEIKYVLITCVVLLALWGITQSGAFESAQRATEDLINWVANEEGIIGGAVGLFLLALFANTSILIQVPYTVPLMNIALVSDSIPNLLFLSIATGIGAGIGEINSYIIARGLMAPIQSPDESRFYRWIKRTIDYHPRSIPWFVALFSASILPDDTLIWPLAIAKYPVRKIVFPMFLGKIFHNFLLALITFYFVDQLSTSDFTVRVDLTVGILIVFVIFILYQIEKARRSELEPTTPLAQSQQVSDEHVAAD